MEQNIIFEDEHIILCHKPAGVATQSARLGQKDMVSELKNYLVKQYKNKEGEPYVGLIHRLDQPVEGLLLFAKNQKAAKKLSEQVAKHVVKKYYLATICGKLEEKEGTLVNYLVKDGKTNTSKIAKQNDKDAKRAELQYKIIKEEKDYTVVEILLLTGRHHQIRVQFANQGFPLLGDMKYGNEKSKEISEKERIRDVSLCAYKLEFNHPVTSRKLSFQIVPIKKELV